MTDTFQIRPIEARDDAAVAHVIRTVMPEFGAGGAGFASQDPEVDTMHSAYTQPGSAYFVVERDGRVMGGCGIGPLQGSDGATCELRKMYFLPALRGLGAGLAMMQRCMETARSMGYTQCYIETLTGMDAAQSVYIKAGFRRIEARMGDTGHFGCDRFFLRKLDHAT